MISQKRKLSRIILTTLIITLFLSNLPATTLQSKPHPAKQNTTNCNESKDVTTNAIYDLLIITPKIFSKHLKLLVYHKNKHDIKTILVSVEEIYSQMFLKGRDEAEKIKYFIKEAIENWGVRYVLLVGGRKDQSAVETWWVPVRYSHIVRKYRNFVENQFLSDLYFADIYDKNGDFSSWDTNNNGIFGEWPENKSALDTPDLYPDVYVGRLPCRNVFEVRVMVRKIINYETGECSDSWFKKMVVVAGDTYPKQTDYYDGEVYTQKGLDMMIGFEPVKLWASTGALKNWVDIVRAINQGCGFVWFSGHGNPALWGTHPPDDGSKWVGYFQLHHMLFLININKLPVCVSGSGCFNSMFNVSLLHYSWAYKPIPRCWSWALTRKNFGGCIATIASTAFSYESPDINTGVGGCEWLDINFFGEYGLKGTDILGETWGNAISTFLQNFTINWCDKSSNGSALIAKNAQQWLLIGDPSLKIGGYPN